MSPLFPLVVRILERKCVVIGGGRVAARRARALAEAGAEVTVVAPALDEAIIELVRSGAVQIIEAPYSPDSLKDAFLAVVATNDSVLNARIAADARAAGCLVNDADEPDRGDCIIPATVRRGPLLISVTTSGASPSLASHIRGRLSDEFGPEYGTYATLLGEARQAALASLPEGASRKRALAAMAADTEILELIRAGKLEEARAKAFACISSSSA
jgi:precorrin-2 dehydrogenase / sirohydrochlorin ferrochelatase